MIVPRLNATFPITSEGVMAPHFRQWTQQASLGIPIIGTGSPEGVIEAIQYSLYLDRNGSTGSIEYRKMLPDVGGNTKMGWVLL